MDETSLIGNESNKPTSDEQTRAKVEQNLAELARRIEVGEIDEKDLDIYFLEYYQGLDEALSRKDVGNQAVVISQHDLEQLGGLRMVLASGEIMFIDPEVTGYGPDDKLVIFPEELGSHKPKE